MSCWTCECGMRNCDVDDCLNPRCPTHRAVPKQEALAMLNSAGLNGEEIISNIRTYDGRLFDIDQITFYIQCGEK